MNKNPVTVREIIEGLAKQPNFDNSDLYEVSFAPFHAQKTQSKVPFKKLEDGIIDPGKENGKRR